MSGLGTSMSISSAGMLAGTINALILSDEKTAALQRENAAKEIQLQREAAEKSAKAIKDDAHQTCLQARFTAAGQIVNGALTASVTVGGTIAAQKSANTEITAADTAKTNATAYSEHLDGPAGEVPVIGGEGNTASKPGDPEADFKALKNHDYSSKGPEGTDYVKNGNLTDEGKKAFNKVTDPKQREQLQDLANEAKASAERRANNAEQKKNNLKQQVNLFANAGASIAQGGLGIPAADHGEKAGNDRADSKYADTAANFMGQVVNNSKEVASQNDKFLQSAIDLGLEVARNSRV
jgi:hypothetical protein